MLTEIQNANYRLMLKERILAILSGGEQSKRIDHFLDALEAYIEIKAAQCSSESTNKKP